ncbi:MULTISPECIES: MetQ/NlpA family ABC transporter substrate-binding protein [Clostridium]|jgi:D-methionine transport system substrate-binding protein|uniref:MetQ/NlpA family ABC transporter substrate-binding protein n=1 Tax=Clostridium TaxID=1485 RepID=UPI00051BB888|nr:MULTISPECIES: MetQ/NlpA family ABC transporter substrate-binding protein [Clostridium]AXB85993.1 MetQ/NlpA family ABC transporter substrate-binding protein [Clostridium butyricum]KIU09166.1 D-methionine-binding lipoprotein MetQ [Clostridium butyricum]MBA8965493.1 D-methionine transport system substrate-binding protein [Clostridium butyricum]MBA8969950.1 D-methionine transport system substrate-binding protein [Clostridium butyricum]MBC2429200.1 MetQ/NlpA family ABC transporter substrate-bind
MKKKSILSVVLAGVLAIGLIGCGGTGSNGSGADSKDDKVIKIGVTPKPHKEIVDAAVPLLEKEGYKVEITEFNDYVQPNTAVEEGSLDVNFFQHTPYLNEQVQSRGLHLKSVAAIHLEPMGLYSKKITSLDELKDGSTIAVPNDPSNEARALKLLAANGLIKIKDGELVTPADITENPKNLQFSELEAAAVPRAVDDVDAAVINGNYAIEAGFDPTANAIVKEDKDSEAAKPYANIVVVKEGNENLEKIQALIKALTSDEVRDFINKEYNGAVIPVF